MKNPIGRTTSSSNGDGCVGKSILGQDVAGTQTTGQHAVHEPTYPEAFLTLFGSLGGNRTTERGHQTNGLHGDPPSVERGRYAATTRPRTCLPKDLVRLFL